MKRTKIEWTDLSWNPVTGCTHGCPYCYAHAMSNRFHWSFTPTLHQDRLDEPLHVQRPSRIFVSSMGDLFDPTVPDAWIQAVLETCQRTPQHQYLFLTKNPQRYAEDGILSRYPRHALDNCWFGASAINNDDMATQGLFLGDLILNLLHSWLSLEPLCGKVTQIFCSEAEWVVVGAMTGPMASRHKLRPEWITALRKGCDEIKLPLFEKNSCAAAVNGPLRHAMPKALAALARKEDA